MKHVRKLSETEFATFDFAGKSARAVKNRQVSIIAKYSSLATTYCRAHEGELGLWTIFGVPKSEPADSHRSVKHSLKLANNWNDANGQHISLKDRIIQAGRERIIATAQTSKQVGVVFPTAIKPWIDEAPQCLM